MRFISEYGHVVFPKKKKKAFTLIELLVVIAIIAMLMAILMPSLTKVKEQGKKIVCQTNMKQLALAGVLYANDWVKITSPWLYAFGFPLAPNGIPVWTSETAIRNLIAPSTDEMDWFTTGEIYPYLEIRDVFLCPKTPKADPRPGLAPIAGGTFGFDTGPEWSYTCNGQPGYGTGPPADDSMLRCNPDQVINPARVLMFLDQHHSDNGAYDNTVLLFNSQWTPGADSLADYHSDGGNLSFFDGHSEYMKRQEFIDRLQKSPARTKAFVGGYQNLNSP